VPKKVAKPAPPKTSILEGITSTVSGWFAHSSRPKTVNLKRKKIATNAAPPPRRTQQTAAPVRRTTSAVKSARKPRLLMLERRRPTADTAVPRLRQRGVDVSVVERWVDAVDEMFRSRPDAIVLDVEHPELEKVHRTITEKNTDLPIILSGRVAASAPASMRRAAFLVRPYDIDELVRLAEKALSSPEDLLAEQLVPRQQPAARPQPAVPKPAPIPVSVTAPPPPPKPQPVAAAPITLVAVESSDSYEVPCFSCRVPFDAVDADWCSCLAKERSLVCTNCLACFCKAPPSYKEKFWVEAPPKLFERKTSEARRQQSALAANPDLADVRRPLVLTVEDDEDIQAIVGRVCSNLGYGFIYATNGQDGLEIARAYRPNLILSDAFMPKLDGREMCRILKEEASFDAKMVVMTGLYTDTKYRSEALKRFHVDDYISKPVAITDLVNLLQKHLEGVTGLPMQEDLHELHRQELDGTDTESHSESAEPELEGIALADLLDTPHTIEVRARSAPAPRAKKSESYEVCCFNCQNNFDATRAEWCTCVGRDQTVVCTHCSGCFCKAPAAYKERFWMDAPPMLFERKMLGSKRHHGDKANPIPSEVKRPLILLVEDDENVQLIVKTVVTTMGFGFVVGANGQEGLSLAREYNPDLILSDAFMPKLDGREMCRLLKEDPTTAGSKAIIMTGLYTDRKYRNEALDYFKVDDYVAKPLAVDDLIKLFKKHLPQEAQTTN
jgi:DNA-binding response OmpR family regulator